MTLVSVTMPVYNAERYVAEAIESILGQTFGDFELIIINDGSTDDSKAVLDGLVMRDPRIRLTSRPNRGISATRNELLSLARGEFVAVLDADDIAMPDRLERQVQFLQTHPECVAVGSRALVIDPDGDSLCEWFPEQSHEEIDALNLSGMRGSAICHSSVMIRKDSILEVGGYREQYSTAEDLDLWLRLAERGRLANLPEALVKYRTHVGSVCHTQNHRQQEAARAAIEDARRHRGLDDVPAVRPQATAPANFDQIRRKWAWWALMAGHVASARKHALAHFARHPLSLDSWRLLYCSLRGH